MPSAVPIDKWADEYDMAVKAVRDLCSRNPKYIAILRVILDVDKAYQSDQFGWEYDKIIARIEWSGANVKALMDAGIIRHGYKSNQYTHYRLNLDYDRLEQILDEIERSIKQPEQSGCGLNRSDVILEPAMITEFEQLIASGQDMLTYWAQRLNPRIIGMEMERQASLITLASPDDKDGLVRRCHTLIYGPPGTAKSVLIAYIKHNLDAVGISPASSEAGLKMDARQGTPGALMLAHKRTLVAEEIDKFDKKSIESMYEAMTTGEFDLNKGDIRQTCAAEIREIAVGNDISRLPAPFIDRFDMIFYYEIPTKDEEKKITDELYMQWIQDKEDFKGTKLRAYLEFIRPFEPAINPDIMDKCLKLKNAYIDLAEKKPDVREKEAFLRVAFVIAKINHRDLTVLDYLRAVRLVDAKLNSEKYHALEIIARGELSK